MLIETSRAAESQDVVTRSIWSLVQKFKLAIHFREVADAFLSVAVLASTDREAFDVIYKAPVASQRGLLLETLQQSAVLGQIVPNPAREFEHFDGESLQALIYSVHEVEDFSAYGDAVIQILADRDVRRAGEGHTEHVLVELLRELAGDLGAQRVYDGAAGYCSLACGMEAGELILEEVDHNAWSIGKKLLCLKKIDAQFSNRNSLLSVDGSANADWLISEPPWSTRLSPDQRKLLEDAVFVRVGSGKRPPSSASDALWIQHAIFNLNETGEALILLPPGWLFRGGYDAKLRQYLLEHDLIDSIVGLPAGICPPTSVAPVIVKLSKKKSAGQTGVVRFVDASELGTSSSRRSSLGKDDIVLIRQLVAGELPEHDCYSATLLPEIHRNQNNLSVKQYVRKNIDIELPDLEREMQELKIAMAHFDQAQQQFLNVLSPSGQEFDDQGSTGR